TRFEIPLFILPASLAPLPSKFSQLAEIACFAQSRISSTDIWTVEKEVRQNIQVEQTKFQKDADNNILNTTQAQPAHQTPAQTIEKEIKDCNTIITKEQEAELLQNQEFSITTGICLLCGQIIAISDKITHSPIVILSPSGKVKQNETKSQDLQSVQNINAKNIDNVDEKVKDNQLSNEIKVEIKDLDGNEQNNELLDQEGRDVDSQKARIDGIANLKESNEDEIKNLDEIQKRERNILYCKGHFWLDGRVVSEEVAHSLVCPGPILHFWTGHTTKVAVLRKKSNHISGSISQENEQIEPRVQGLKQAGLFLDSSGRDWEEGQIEIAEHDNAEFAAQSIAIGYEAAGRNRLPDPEKEFSEIGWQDSLRLEPRRLALILRQIAHHSFLDGDQ
ncbi:MAG: hypothetical protein EZS28_016111, partial [Streblomastix strix]